MASRSAHTIIMSNGYEEIPLNLMMIPKFATLVSVLTYLSIVIGQDTSLGEVKRAFDNANVRSFGVRMARQFHLHFLTLDPRRCGNNFQSNKPARGGISSGCRSKSRYPCWRAAPTQPLVRAKNIPVSNLSFSHPLSRDRHSA